MTRDGSSRKGDAPVSCCAFGPLANWAKALEGKDMEFDPIWLFMVVLIAWAAIAWAEADLRETERQRRRK